MNASNTSEILTGPWLADSLARIEAADRFTVSGRVIRVIGQVVESTSLPIAVGEVCRISLGEEEILAQAVGFHQDGVLLMPLGELVGIRPGAIVTPLGRPFTARAGENLIGRVINGLGRPIDGLGPIRTTRRRSLSTELPNPLERAPIHRKLGTGVRYAGLS